MSRANELAALMRRVGAATPGDHDPVVRDYRAAAYETPDDHSDRAFRLMLLGVLLFARSTASGHGKIRVGGQLGPALRT